MEKTNDHAEPINELHKYKIINDKNHSLSKGSLATNYINTKLSMTKTDHSLSKGSVATNYMNTKLSMTKTDHSSSKGSLATNYINTKLSMTKTTLNLRGHWPRITSIQNYQ